METPWQEAKRRAIVSIMQKYATRYYNVMIQQGRVAMLGTDHEWLQIQDYVTQLNGGDKGYFLITLNPPKDELPSLKSVVQRIRDYQNFLGKMTWTYEVRSLDTGLHVHILAEDIGKPKSDILKRCYNALRKYFPDATPQAVNVKHSNEDALAYIKGDKKDPSKMEKMQFSYDYRKINHLQAYYEE